jgi:hypothetical protein
MLIGTIDCDIEGKIARRYMMDLMHRKFNRSNSITVNDLKKLKLHQVSITYHESLINFCYVNDFAGARSAVQFHRSTSWQVQSSASVNVQNTRLRVKVLQTHF